MTDEETIALGTFCEGLMQSHAFNMLHEMFKQQQIDAVFNSAPEDTAHRERAYTELHGVAKLLGLMRSLKQRCDAIITANETTPQLSPEDAE